MLLTVGLTTVSLKSFENRARALSEELPGLLFANEVFHMVFGTTSFAFCVKSRVKKDAVGFGIASGVRLATSLKSLIPY